MRAAALLQAQVQLGDMSLRAIAGELDTSHRMLIYHFGSRDGLLAAVLTHLRQEDQKRYLRLGLAEGSGKVVEAIWQEHLDTSTSARGRAFFYILGKASRDPETYRGFLESLEDTTLLLADLIAGSGVPPDKAYAQAFLSSWSARLFGIARHVQDGTGAGQARERAVRALIGL
ncbi:hypothetical protein AWB85_19100 [Mycobacteroides immunogenum]|uniref:Uncharacterized protein n=1 Tax=Mycobacteroides immunogenum TaxID=83262 RepID=A0A179VCZ4_9MYCO|nr:hypothetical protein AWB85_19100 [Mycobacteroides immunogenum]